MKKIILLGVAVLLCIPAVEAKKKKKVKVQVADTVTMTTAQKQSYALGANLGATCTTTLQNPVFLLIPLCLQTDWSMLFTMLLNCRKKR